MPFSNKPLHLNLKTSIVDIKRDIDLLITYIDKLDQILTYRLGEQNYSIDEACELLSSVKYNINVNIYGYSYDLKKIEYFLSPDNKPRFDNIFSIIDILTVNITILFNKDLDLFFKESEYRSINIEIYTIIKQITELVECANSIINIARVDLNNLNNLKK